jgi:hypothetical protein
VVQTTGEEVKKDFPRSKLEAIVFVHDPATGQDIRMRDIPRLYPELASRIVYQTQEQQMFGAPQHLWKCWQPFKEQHETSLHGSPEGHSRTPTDLAQAGF